jgi:hypothetical protein
MPGRIASSVAPSRWALASAAVGLAVSIVIATAPKPTSRSIAPVIVEPTPREDIAVADRRACGTDDAIELQLARGRAFDAADRRYIALMTARSLDCDRAYAAAIDEQLATVAPRAAATFLVHDDHTNAAAAVLVAKSLGIDSRTVRTVDQYLQRYGR